MPLVEEKQRYIAGDEKYWLAFSRVSGIGVVRMQRLFDYFGSLQAAWQARPADLMAAHLEPKYTERLMIFRPNFDPDSEMARLEQLGIRLLVVGGPGYPERLAQSDMPPPILYMKGQLEDEADRLALAVVGTRRATSYGRQATRQICTELVGQGVTIVSGLAKGIDTAAHLATLEANGRTIAVLGSGLDVIYPYENKALAERVCEHGALLSEYPPGAQPEASNFPARNRIISGLAMGVFVVESDEKGGAMNSSWHANRQGRDVFALPGSILNQFSRGTNALIRRGEARLVTCATDILEELLPGNLLDTREARAELVHIGDTETERAILRMLRQAGEPVHIDEICQECSLPTPEVNSTLVMLELKGLIQNMGGMRYGLSRLSSPLDFRF